MNPHLRKLTRRALLAFTATVALLAIISVSIWALRTDIATRVAQSYLQDLDLDTNEFTLSSLQLDSLSIDDIQIAKDGVAVSVETLTVTFDLSDLLDKYQIDTATIRGLRASLPPLPTSSEEQAPETPSLQELCLLLDLGQLKPIPFQCIQIVDSSISSPFGEINVDATAKALEPDQIELSAQLSHGQDTLALDATLSDPTHSSLDASLHLASASSSLAAVSPSWQATIPELEHLAAGPLDATIKLSTRPSTAPELTLDLQLQDLDLNYDSLETRIPTLSLSSSFNDFASIPISITFTPDLLKREDLEVQAGKAITLSANLIDQQVVKIQTQTPIPWSYDSNFIHGQSQATLSYDLSKTENPLQATIETSAFVLSDTELAPFSLLAKGNTDTIDFQTSALRQASSSPASLANGSGRIHIPEADADPINLSFTAELQPAPLLINGAPAALPDLNLQLEAQILDDSSHSSIALKSQSASTLFDLPETASLNGQVQLLLDLTLNNLTDRYQGSVSLDASNISIQSDFLSGNEIGIQSKIEFQDIDSDAFDSDNPLSEANLKELLSHTRTTLDWQANQLATPDLNAQWSGGSLAIENRDQQIHINSTFGSGILEYDTIRLEQVYLESEQSGTLQELDGATTLTAMLQGNVIEVGSQQHIRNPLEALSLNGEYTLTPLHLEHSDLPGLFAAEFAGISVSGDLEATGSYHASTDSADSSLALKFRKGELSYPASQLNAQGIEIDLSLDSLASLNSGETASKISIENIQAGDAKASLAKALFRIQNGAQLAIDSSEVTVFGGKILLDSTEIPIDGSDFKSALNFSKISLEQIASYVEIFDGEMEGEVSGSLPFQMKNGRFELQSGSLTLPDGSLATLRYHTEGLLTEEQTDAPAAKPSFSERLLSFLQIDPDRSAEEALGNITITRFDAELFPDDAPGVPIRLHIEGTAHSKVADIPVVITTQVYGSLSELYNFLIRLNSL